MAILLDVTLAYIDPGAGSLFIQVVIATILAAPFIVRTKLSRLSRAIRERISRRHRP